MIPATVRSVHRYFEPVDRFVQIAVLGPEAFGDLAGQALSGAAWRHAVVERCVPELPDEQHREAAYRLCVEVNPRLDLHCVQLTGSASSAVPTRAKRHNAPEAAPTMAGTGSPAPLDLSERVRGLRQRLTRQLIGQEAAVEAMARAVERAAAGLHAAHRPLASFLFVGRTGTGKTEAARTLAREVYGEGEPRPLLRIDCSEYALAHETARLLGAPPGYVGHDDGGFLISELAKRQGCVVLFDEVEKAHPRLHQLLLQVLEEGVLTDGKGRTASFAHSIVVLTSNAGATEMETASRRMGFAAADSGLLGSAEVHDLVHTALRRQFAPEFLGRLDETIVFADLTPEALERIAARLLGELALRARQTGTKVAFGPEIAAFVAARCAAADPHGTAAGARALRRVLQHEVETPLAEWIVTARRRDGLARAQLGAKGVQFLYEA